MEKVEITFENGSNLETIGNEVFAYNQISGELTIPSSVTTIGLQAFYNANGYENALTTININMTESEFANVSKSTPWYSGTPTINYN